MRVLLDTNIILDFALERHPFYSNTIQVFTANTLSQIASQSKGKNNNIVQTRLIASLLTPNFPHVPGKFRNRSSK